MLSSFFIFINDTSPIVFFLTESNETDYDVGNLDYEDFIDHAFNITTNEDFIDEAFDTTTNEDLLDSELDTTSNESKTEEKVAFNLWLALRQIIGKGTIIFDNSK